MVTVQTKRGDPQGGDRTAPLCFVVTDIETDGPNPGANSMRSFASVAVDETGRVIDQFEGCLAELDGAVPDAETLAWLQGQADAWADATRDPRPPAAVMQDLVGWVRALPMEAVFVAHPLMFDGVWMDWYLRRFTGLRLETGPYGGERLFRGAGLDLPSLVMGVTGRPYAQCRRSLYPESWLGGHVHTHRAIDDALGYASLLVEMWRQGATVRTAGGRT